MGLADVGVGDGEGGDGEDDDVTGAASSPPEQATSITAQAAKQPATVSARGEITHQRYVGRS